MARVDDLPPEAALDAANFRRFGTKSNVILPLRFAGGVTGMLSFAMTGRERDWPPDPVMRLEFVARISPRRSGAVTSKTVSTGACSGWTSHPPG